MLRMTKILFAMLVGAGLVAACSDGDDSISPELAEPTPYTAPGPAPIEPPAPEQDPVPMTPPAPGADVRPDADAPSAQEQEETASDKSVQDKIGDAAKTAGDRAAEMGSAIADKAGELADRAGEAAVSARESIKKGAEKADKAIQDSIGNGDSNTNGSKAGAAGKNGDTVGSNAKDS